MLVYLKIMEATASIIFQSRSRSAKFIDLDANLKHTCNFLVVSILVITLDVSRTVFDILTHNGV